MAPTRPPVAAKPVLVLPTQRTVPAQDLAAYSILIYGREKAGKTTLVAEFPDVIFLGTEPGTKNLPVYAVFPRNWPEFVGYIDLLEREPTRFKNTAVDTIDLAFDMCEAWVCQKLGVSHASEGDFGQVWSAIRKEFAKQMARLQAMKRGLIFISHAQEKEIKGRDRVRGQTSRHIMQPTMSGQARRVIEPMVDIWGYYELDPDSKRVLYVQGSDEFSAGNRMRNHFMIPGANPPRQLKWIPMGDSSSEAYKNFIRAFENKMPDPEAPASPATRPGGGLRRRTQQ